MHSPGIKLIHCVYDIKEDQSRTILFLLNEKVSEFQTKILIIRWNIFNSRISIIADITILNESKVSAYFLNCPSYENVRFLPTHSVYNHNSTSIWGWDFNRPKSLCRDLKIMFFSLALVMLCFSLFWIYISFLMRV